MASLRTAIELARSGKKLQALEILRTLVEMHDALKSQRVKENVQLPDTFPVISVWRK